jgi:hypothetical protein
MDESEFRSLAKWQISVPLRYSEKQNSILAEDGGADSSVDFCSSANFENFERYLSRSGL